VAGEPVDGLDAGEPNEAHHHFARARDAPPDETRVPALGHDREALGGTRLDHRGDLRRAAGANDEPGTPVEAARPVRLVGGAKVVRYEDVLWAHDGGEPSAEGVFAVRRPKGRAIHTGIVERSRQRLKLTAASDAAADAKPGNFR
jgi:hypothetical protein